MSNVITTTNLSAQGLEKFQQQIASKSQDELQAIAKQQLREIVLKVQDLTKNIEKAKSLTKEANRKNSFWEMINPIADSEEKRRGKLNTQAIALNTETDKQLAELFQSSIVLTTCSFAFAQAMRKEIDATIVSGLLTLEDDLKDLSDDHTELSDDLKDLSDDHTELSDDVTDFLEKVRERANIFLNQQKEYEKRQEKQEQDIDNIHSRLEYKDELDNQQDKKIEALEAELETKRAKITELQGALESKKQIDDSQEQKISALESRVQILESRNNKGGSLNLITSVIALLGAVASIALQFLR